MKNNFVVERHGTQRWLRYVIMPCKLYMMIIWYEELSTYKLKFSQLIKHLLFYIPYEIYMHSLKSIDFIASVYERFDNPSYVLLHNILFKRNNLFTINHDKYKVRNQQWEQLHVHKRQDTH